MLIATFDATAFNFMARFVCNSSIDEVWPLICSVVPAGRTTEITALARHVIFRARRSSWSDLIRLELSSDPNVDGSIIRITAAPPCQTQVVRRVLLVVAIGLMVGLFLAMITNHRGLAAVLCFLLIGTLVPYVSLVQHLFSQARRTSKVVVDRIQEHIRLRQVEPFDVRISPIEFYVLTPVLLLASAAVCFAVVGFVLGAPIILAIIAAFGALIVQRQRLNTWGGAMYGLHNSWLGLFMCSALPWLVILAIGATCTLWADGRWNPATQMSPPFDKVLIGHFSPESAGVATPSVVARNLISKMPGSRRYELVRRLIMTLLLIISACVLFFIFIVRMTLGTLRTLRFSQQRHEPYYALGEGGTEMLPQHVTLMVSAVIYSVVYWSMSLWSLDVGWYLATGRVLWLPAMAWSLQFVRLNVVAAGVPPLLASWLVYGTVALLCSPGLFLPVIALTRLGRGGFCEILRFVRARPLSKSCLSTHAAFLLRLCQELHIRPPRVVCDPHGDLHIYTEHSWLHRGGYLIVSHGCLPWLCEKEVDAVLAHEMHHLAHDRFRLAVLKAASVLLLSPMYYLTILFDFAHAERRADAFAVTTVKEASVLRSALVKLDIFSIRSSNATSERIQARAWGHVLQRISQLAAMGRYLRMLYTDEIVGAAYPPLSQRLAWIRTAVEEKDEHRLPK